MTQGKCFLELNTVYLFQISTEVYMFKAVHSYIFSLIYLAEWLTLMMENVAVLIAHSGIFTEESAYSR